MFLIKCKCGCVFTITADALDGSRLSCQNCKRKIDSDAFMSPEKRPDLLKQFDSVSYIPENAKITVTFDT